MHIEQTLLYGDMQKDFGAKMSKKLVKSAAKMRKKIVELKRKLGFWERTSLHKLK